MHLALEVSIIKQHTRQTRLFTFIIFIWLNGLREVQLRYRTTNHMAMSVLGAKEFKVALTNNDTVPNSPTDTNVVDCVGAACNCHGSAGSRASNPNHLEQNQQIYVDTDNR